VVEGGAPGPVSRCQKIAPSCAFVPEIAIFRHRFVAISGVLILINGKPMKILVSMLLVILALQPTPGQAQKIGVLTFEDASGVGDQFGEQVAKYIRAEMLKNKKFIPKFIKYVPQGDESASVDVEKAVALGKKNGVEYVVIGTILEAESNSSSTGIGGVQVFGQRVGTSLRTVSASITIQADLLSVKDGKVMESFRTSGSDTNSSVGADVNTEWGSFNADKDGTADTPTAKALREAVEDLVEEITTKLG